MPMIPRVAAYCRVSTFEQHADIQVEAIRRAARERGWNLVAEHVDAGVSGGRDRRPALDVLLEQVERHEVDVVVVARLDRLGRTLAHVLACSTCSRSTACSSSRSPTPGWTARPPWVG